MLGGVAWSIFCGASLTTAWYATFDRYAPQLMPFLLGLMAASGAAALLRRLELRVRATLVLGSLFVTGTYGIMQSGFSPNAVLGLAVVSVVGALLLGRTTGLATAVGGSATLFLVAWGHQSGVLTRTALWTASVDSASLANAVRVSGIFLLLCGTMVVGVSFLLSRTERLALEKAQSLATLEAEQAAKERIARDLELGEATFRKAQELEILGRLAGSMAHDFNNSLVVIWSALEELKFLGPLPKAMEPAIEAMRAAAEQAASTTKQLRAFGPRRSRSRHLSRSAPCSRRRRRCSVASCRRTWSSARRWSATRRSPPTRARCCA
jgi:signal transduction histidine kinase